MFIPGNKLRLVINEARAKGTLHLLQKLIPLVFSDEELAHSCGQGISGHTNKPQTGEPLDNVKVQV